MKRILLNVGIFALTFGLSVGVSAGWQLYKSSLLPFDAKSDVPVPERAATPKIAIVRRMAALGSAASYQTIDLSDGTQISQSCERLSSPGAAERTLQKRLVNAEVVERSQNRDEKGRVIAETILTTSPRVMRLGTYGNSLCVTDAASLNHLRLYEAGALQYSSDSGKD